MATDLTRLPLRGQQGSFHVVVESPRGSTVKLKYDTALQAFSISRPLTRGLRYPFDWGFIPSTKGPDGDPLDAMPHLQTYQQLSKRERDELEHFFLAAVHFADKDARILGWEGPEGAERMLRQYALPEG
ncbi:inorganic diphosphatase [Myxococcus sp. RHSTA-1-4]|uniref:inorganic diphosphatase n=1 Tax=Myxococcus sp. RHSTA-1-4 TaxID=2874601 RepID=UPI001CBC9338|nr:inorganic diphosphatase [Myxococcus sp. RHSTA-1-4]MBZ4415505.1 inorganic diphosphatase [Myxococcus sp. RHSTA-1-4]